MKPYRIYRENGAWHFRGTRRSPEEIARVLAERYGQTEEIRRKVLQSCA